MIEELRKELEAEVNDLTQLIALKQKYVGELHQRRTGIDAQIEQAIGEANQAIGQMKGTRRALEKLNGHAEPKDKVDGEE